MRCAPATPRAVRMPWRRWCPMGAHASKGGCSGEAAALRSPSLKKKKDGVVRHLSRSLNSSLVPSLELPVAVGGGGDGVGGKQWVWRR